MGWVPQWLSGWMGPPDSMALYRSELPDRVTYGFNGGILGSLSAVVHKEDPIRFDIDCTIPNSPQTWDEYVAAIPVSEDVTIDDQADRVVYSLDDPGVLATHTVFKASDGSLHCVTAVTRRLGHQDPRTWSQFCAEAEIGTTVVPV